MKREKVTVPHLREKKSHAQKITMLTAYDYPMGRLVDEGGIDIILVGDSLGMVVLGYDSTLLVTMEDMIRHTQAVRRGVKYALFLVITGRTFLHYKSYFLNPSLNSHSKCHGHAK